MDVKDVEINLPQGKSYASNEGRDAVGDVSAQDVLGYGVEGRGQQSLGRIAGVDSPGHVDDVAADGVEGAQGLGDGRQRVDARGRSSLLNSDQVQVRPRPRVPALQVGPQGRRRMVVVGTTHRGLGVGPAPERYRYRAGRLTDPRRNETGRLLWKRRRSIAECCCRSC